MRSIQTRGTKFLIAVTLPVLLVSGASLAGPAPKPAAKAKPLQGDTDRGADVRSVPTIQSSLEGNVGELAGLLEGAKSDGDAVRAACVAEKVDRGRDVMEVATGELLIIRDQRSTGQQRSFAVEKLQAAANRLDGVVTQARTCAGDQSPDKEDDVTTNEVDETQTIPLNDPTLGGTTPFVPPAIDANVPQTVASPSQ